MLLGCLLEASVHQVFSKANFCSINNLAYEVLRSCMILSEYSA